MLCTNTANPGHRNDNISGKGLSYMVLPIRTLVATPQGWCVHLVLSLFNQKGKTINLWSLLKRAERLNPLVAYFMWTATQTYFATIQGKLVYHLGCLVGVDAVITINQRWYVIIKTWISSESNPLINMPPRWCPELRKHCCGNNVSCYVSRAG